MDNVSPEQNKALALGSRGRPEAAALMWTWQNNAAPDNGARAAALRNKGMLSAGVGLAAAGIFFALGHPTLASIVGAIALFTLITALVSPTGVYASIDGKLITFGRWVGTAVGWVVLMPVFVGFFVPFGLLFRRGAADPMKRAFDRSSASYWRKREADEDVEGRRKSQF